MTYAIQKQDFIDEPRGDLASRTLAMPAPYQSTRRHLWRLDHGLDGFGRLDDGRLYFSRSSRLPCPTSRSSSLCRRVTRCVAIRIRSGSAHPSPSILRCGCWQGRGPSESDRGGVAPVAVNENGRPLPFRIASPRGSSHAFPQSPADCREEADRQDSPGRNQTGIEGSAALAPDSVLADLVDARVRAIERHWKHRFSWGQGIVRAANPLPPTPPQR